MDSDQQNINEINQSLKKAKTYSTSEKVKRWVPSVIIIPIAVFWVINRGEYGLLDNIDLVIHEAGHLIFSLFGKYIYTMGGTLMQVILPSIIASFFFRNNYRTGVQFGLLWLGQNFINISVYAADARAQKLALLGGNKVYHDWHYLLGEIGILEYDQLVGYIFVGFAIIIFLVAILMPLLTHD
jgi:hypothetical protein